MFVVFSMSQMLDRLRFWIGKHMRILCSPPFLFVVGLISSIAQISVDDASDVQIQRNSEDIVFGVENIKAH